MVERYQVGALARGELSNARLETRTAVIEDNIGRVKGDTTEMRGTTVRIEEATDEIQTHLQVAVLHRSLPAVTDDPN
ncbi:hypothetical protein OF83DRAFT_1140346 [Amylostereum chailletii]|nr:hypothetical protein OF83DRAFT_1140346 [Amylostereum chailletii]